jgi:hypothetical protein
VLLRAGKIHKPQINGLDFLFAAQSQNSCRSHQRNTQKPNDECLRKPEIQSPNNYYTSFERTVRLSRAFLWGGHVSRGALLRIAAKLNSVLHCVIFVIRNPKSEILFMPRFVVLIHDFPELHWDFMLENEAALRTWRLSRQPLEPGPIDAEALADHRLAYLDYEGPVSGNRGTVRGFDRGEFTVVAESAGRIVIELCGAVLRGTAVLERSGESNASTFAFTPAD